MVAVCPGAGRRAAPGPTRTCDLATCGRGSAMIAPVTLSIYIARQFVAGVMAMTLALTGLVALFDLIELLRRSVGHPEATFAIVTEIEALRLLFLTMQILPFGVLLG